MLHAVLKVVGGKQDGKLIPLNTKFLIGREQDCHLRLGSESVSRHHCAITIDDFTVRVRDLGSSNGTSINGKRIIGVHEANPGDKLQIGNLDFEIVFSKAGSPVTSGAPDTGGTSFTLDDFNLEEAEPVSDTTMLVGGDTAVISRKDLDGAAVSEQEEIGSTAEQASAPEQASAEPPAEATAVSEQPVETQADGQQAAEAPNASPVAAEAAPTASESAPPAGAILPPATEVPPAAQQQPAAPQPGYPQQPGYPPMPGYGQQMPQQPYPYGMPQPAMPGYGMPPQGYPYGMPQPGMPGYGMPQQGMPGYGMPQQPAMPGYGMPYPGQQMPYPAQQMPYPAAQPVDNYDDDEEDDEDEVSSKFQEPPTSLPDPSETGAREEVKTDVDEGPKVAAPNPAADILKKYMGGR
jgi:hypothetical protein